MFDVSKITQWGVAMFLAVGLAGCTTVPPAPPTFAEPFASIDAAAQSMTLGRGVNVLGYDPVWIDPAKAKFTPAHFKLIHDAGFQNVRIVLQSFDYIDADGKLSPDWLATLDTMVKAALDQGLTVILDEHDWLLCGKDAATCKIKLHAFWSQIAPRYKNAPSRVIFELLNEPHGAITDDVWNEMLAETLALVRASNPNRNIVIGAGHWNGLESLATLKLPESDRHIITTFHYYHPMTFTHQGAPWVDPNITALSNIPWGSDADFALLNKEFDIVKSWSAAHDRPIYLGEFGAYDKAPMEYRVKWDGAVARAAETRGFSWGYWQFDPDFVLFDMQKQKFVEPILNALVPK